MAKELSIKEIKEEIIEKLMNNFDILDYFREYSKELQISKFRNSLIFDHDTSQNHGSYIAVEVSEYSRPCSCNIGDRSYSVLIKMSHEKEEKICDMAETVSSIVNKLYPSLRKFANVSVKTTVHGMFDTEYEKLHRVISFIIE